MKLAFVSLLSSDKLKLPGLLYEPDKPTKKAAIWLHGMGDSGVFYNPERINALGKALTGKASTMGQPSRSFAQTTTYTNGGCGAASQGL